MKGTKTLLSYLLFIIGLQWKTVYALPQTCNEGEFMCLNKRCINGGWKCDGDDDCGDNSDEENCPKTTKTCNPRTHFQCGNGQCIPESWTCDNMNDCGDNTDETTAWLNCPKSYTCDSNHFQCAVSKQCIFRYEHCDGSLDCGPGDDSDEKNCEKKTCASDEFQCNNGFCISHNWVCDKNNDCKDGSDEVNCNSETCSADRFKCVTSGHCIFSDYKCDGERDCIDGSDEKDCVQTKAPITQALKSATNQSKSTKMLTTTTTTVAPCLNHQFKCEKSQKCIHNSWICDGEVDCPDEEDEADKTCLARSCANNEFKCSNGKCIKERAKCDGTNHCSDGSDEKDCKSLQITCNTGTFSCANSSKCIDYSMVCNGVKNCPNGDDEDPRCGVNECQDSSVCSHYCFDKDIGYECKCKLGYELAEDGKTCIDLNECKQFGICSHKCENTKGSFVCSCDKGYSLATNKRTCIAGAPEPVLVFSNRFDVRQISTSGRDYKLISNTRFSAAISLDVKDEMIYWTDLINQTINRIHRSASSSQEPEVVVYGLEKPESLAVDWIGRKLYWVDTGKNVISVSNLDGSHKKTIIKGMDFSDIRTLAVYPEKGYIFWSVWGDEAKIERANLSGENRITILDSYQVKWVSGIAVDHTTERVFWTDMHMRHICSSDINGNDKRVVISELTSPYGIAVFEDYVYWTDDHVMRLFKANKFNGAGSVQFGNYLSEPMGISVYHPLVQTKLLHPCEKDNGGCSHLCFITLNNSTECGCPDGYLTLDKDGKKCIAQKIQPTKTPGSTQKCEYKCHSSKKCILTSQLCDGVFNCPEHDDERNCLKDKTTAKPTIIGNPSNVNQTGEKNDSMKTIIAGVVATVVIIIVVIAIVICKRKKNNRGLSIVYETDQDQADEKVNNEKVSIKYFPKNRKQNSDKNFSNVNFREDSRLPLQMNDVYGDTVVDEYPGGDDFDDRTPIIPLS